MNPIRYSPLYTSPGVSMFGRDRYDDLMKRAKREMYEGRKREMFFKSFNIYESETTYLYVEGT